MEVAHLGGISLEYETGGSPNGEPVLMISPVLADGFLPLFSESRLASKYRLIRYHKRGWVGSTRTAGPVSVAEHVADAAALLGRLGIKRAHIVGHSSGAAVALEMAVDHPALVGSLSLLETTLLSVPAADGFLKRAQPAFEAFASGRHADAFASFMTLASGLAPDAWREVLDKNVPGCAAQSIKDADTFFGVELPGLLQWRFDADAAKKVGCPTLSVLGSNTEPLWVEVDQQLRKWLPKIETSTITGVGHLLHIQKSQPVANALAAFFESHSLR